MMRSANFSAIALTSNVSFEFFILLIIFLLLITTPSRHAASEKSFENVLRTATVSDARAFLINVLS